MSSGIADQVRNDSTLLAFLAMVWGIANLIRNPFLGFCFYSGQMDEKDVDVCRRYAGDS
jgi:hypothetical protein